jgi:Glutamyl- and glutaminyl-tRNA synthetases
MKKLPLDLSFRNLETLPINNSPSCNIFVPRPSNLSVGDKSINAEEKQAGVAIARLFFKNRRREIMVWLSYGVYLRIPLNILYLRAVPFPMLSKSFVRTRIAPTPSGFLHVGNIFSFAITASLARKTGAAILLRIDDLDQARVQEQYVRDIFESLNFLGIPWDEGPKDYGEYKNKFSQLHRLPLYENALHQLREGGHVFACSCSRTTREKCNCRNKDLSLDDPNNAWRIYTPPSAELPPTMHEFIVKKKDGFPSYQLACVVDDNHYNIDLIIRGDDLRDSSKAQWYLAKLLGYTSFTSSTIIHHRLLMESPEQKLSKSAGSTSIQYLRKEGKSPEEIFELVSKMAGLSKTLRYWKEFDVALETDL